jgi:hypothetical protein
MRKFTERDYFLRVLSRTSDNEGFADFGQRLTAVATDLQLGLSVDESEQGKEDLMGAREGVQQGIDLVLEILRESGLLSAGIQQQLHAVCDEQMRALEGTPADQGTS